MKALDLLSTRDYEQVLVLRHRGRLAAFVVIHDTRLGPAFGGVRRHRYPDAGAALADAMDLAAAMTWKAALAGLPGGGGKAVILDAPDLDRPGVYALLARHVQLLGGRFYTGPDAGTTAEDLAVMARHTDFVAHDPALGDVARATALGVLAAMRATAARLGHDSLQGLKVAVQGLGAVGSRLCAMLAEAGAALVVADVDPRRVAAVTAASGVEDVEPNAILEQPCDLLSPCALGGVIDPGLAERLPARAVVGAANNVLADDEAGAVLHRRGVLCPPDFVVNAGGLIHGATFHLQGTTPDDERIARIGDTTGKILDRSRAEDLPPRTIALRLARQKVEGCGGEPYFPRR